MAADRVDSEDDFDFSDDENQKGFALKNNSKVNQMNIMSSKNDDSDEDNNEHDIDESDDDEEVDRTSKTNKKSVKSFFDKTNESSDDEDDDENDNNKVKEDIDNDDDDQYFGYLSGGDDEEDGETSTSTTDKKKTQKPKVKKLTAKQLEKEEKRIKKSGVVYLSSLPPYMKPQKIRQIMSRFGEVGRIFLKPEDPKVYKSRIKSGGNKKKKFEEGWVEFTSKNIAKLAAETLNGNILGGKKRSFYHDDVMNVKYLKGFKWFDLTNALNREVEVRESKKQAELSQAHKINKAFIKNVETSKTINRVKESRKRKLENEDDAEGDDNQSNNKKTTEIRRDFKQRNVVTNRADANDSIKSKSDNSQMKNVLSKIF